MRCFRKRCEVAAKGGGYQPHGVQLIPEGEDLGVERVVEVDWGRVDQLGLRQLRGWAMVRQ